VAENPFRCWTTGTDSLDAEAIDSLLGLAKQLHDFGELLIPGPNLHEELDRSHVARLGFFLKGTPNCQSFIEVR